MRKYQKKFPAISACRLGDRDVFTDTKVYSV